MTDWAACVARDCSSSITGIRVSAKRAKLGLAQVREGDADLIGALLEAMHAGKADFTLTFRRLGSAVAAGAGSEPGGGPRNLFADPAAFDHWAEGWQRRLSEEDTPAAQRIAAMQACNPARIPRNHRVEQAIRAAVDDGDITPARQLLNALAQPFDDAPSLAAYDSPARDDERVTRTFCGT